ncbi:hypothetical protein H5410_045317 [Solanum commersonii]|uniref:Uncharacterized protein n=1 Tax=Solanum commersonii TaxID=4109 RepID=A0A9J5X9A5_SOLCO|nr:hypothetical protein H5410_045317 [Solanum commersonii]
MEAPEALLSKLQMQSSVGEYLSQFEKLSNQTSDVSPPLMKHIFISGLHLDIKSDVLASRPSGLNAINLAAYKNKKNEKYQKGHRCSSPHQLLLLLADDDPIDAFPSDSSPPPSDSPPQDTSPENPSLLTISFQALLGGPHSSTLRFTGSMRGISTQILIDGGSTHIFIQPRAAKSLKLLIEPSFNFSVMVGNGQQLQCLGVIHGVSLTIQGFSFSTDFFVIDMYGADVAIGVVWLATLGPSLTDYVNRVFEFTLAGTYHSWVGDQGPSLAQINMSTLMRLTQTDSISYFLRLNLQSIAPIIPPTHPTDLYVLLNTYSDVFQSPKNLPLSQPQDHHIPLFPGVNPANVRPYRYPHFQ